MLLGNDPHSRFLHSPAYKKYKRLLKISDVILVWKYELLPLLEEYCYSDYSKINKMLFGTDKDTVWITQSKGIEEIKTDNIDDMLNKIISNNKND